MIQQAWKPSFREVVFTGNETLGATLLNF
jgi:hypothetical protein